MPAVISFYQRARYLKTSYRGPAVDKVAQPMGEKITKSSD